MPAEGVQRVTADDIITAILVREGGFVNDRADRGGATNFGITQSTLAEFRRAEVSAADVANLTEAEARTIYRKVYVEPWEGVVPETVLPLMADCAVNHGPRGATKMLQKSVGVEADGAFGPSTQAAVLTMDAPRLYRKLCAERVRFYGRLISLDNTQAKFASGWLNRAAEFIEA